MVCVPWDYFEAIHTEPVLSLMSLREEKKEREKNRKE